MQQHKRHFKNYNPIKTGADFQLVFKQEMNTEHFVLHQIVRDFLKVVTQEEQILPVHITLLI